jgi:hypothetical protein
LDASGVRTGGGFGETEGAEDFAGGKTAEVALFLILCAVGEERELDRGIGDGNGSGHGGVHFGNFLKHEDVGDSVQAGATPFFGHEHAATAEGAEFLDDVEREMIGALPVFDVRADFGVHEGADGVPNEELVIGEGEIHGGR